MTTVAPGDIILAGDMNKAALGRRVGSASIMANSATFTTITVLVTLTVNLVAGCTYALKWEGRLSSSVSNAATELALIHIKPGTGTGGTDLNVTQVVIGTNSSAGFATDLYAEFTASTTGSQAFVVCAERTTSPLATGNYAVRASTTGPAYFTCEYVVG